ncbi:uncharacterized protein LOC118509022 isoform X2 [Anopheles stephensi]|nr:uncharacterized protein LOC118509022 isoform X2 [Anopheles stephensi]
MFSSLRKIVQVLLESKKMTLRIAVLLGLLGLILLTLAGVIWSIETFTEWLLQTGTISWFLSFFPNLFTRVAIAAVKAILLHWIPSSLVWTIIHVKLQSITFSHVPNTSTLVLAFEEIVSIYQDITTNVRSLTITLDISSNVSPWIIISIVEPYICKSISNRNTAPTQPTDSAPASEPKPIEPHSWLSTLLNYENGGLLQVLLRNVKFCATDGTMRVVDRTKSFEFYVDAQVQEFGLREHRSISEELTYTNDYKLLYVKKLNAKIFVKSDASATLHCSYFSLHIANAAGKRLQPYSSNSLNVLLGRQHWMFDVWIQLAGFYLGTYELNEHVHPRGEILFARQIEMKLSNFKDTGKLRLSVELPICLEYSPELARFIEWVLRCMAHYRPPVPTANRTSVVPIPTKEKTFPAALDMDIDVTLGMVSCLLWNEHNSCLLVNWKQLTMTKANGETKIEIQTTTLQLGDYGEFTNVEQGNEKLVVEKIVITHGDDNPYFQDLFVNLIKPIVTWNSDVHQHIKQMVKEMQIFAAQLTPLLPPPAQPGKGIHGSIICHDVRILIPVTSVGPTVEVASGKFTLRAAGKQSLSMWDTVISAGIVTVATHKFLCIESEDSETRGGWIMTTYDRDPFEINKTSLYNVVFNGFLPMYEWLRKWW